MIVSPGWQSLHLQYTPTYCLHSESDLAPMANEIEKSSVPVTAFQDEGKLESLGVNDASVIPKGTIDPVYEAKARVLNHAVSLNRQLTISCD
jgi:hypothetical protein